MGISKIEWTERTWNPITGCTPISEGCQNCYARRMAQRLKGRCGYPAADPFRVTLHKERLGEPYHWRNPSRVFVCSMGDLFHEDVPDKWIMWVINEIYRSPHTFLMLTKRPKRMCDFFAGYTSEDWSCFPNLWLGVTCENQPRADERIPLLLQIPAAVRFVSVEPMLESIDLSAWLDPDVFCCGGEPEYCQGCERGSWLREKRAYDENGRIMLDWVICGGETGPGARPMQSDWARGLRDQCVGAGVPFFFKKHGDGWCKDFKINPRYRENRELDGQMWEQYPVPDAAAAAVGD